MNQFTITSQNNVRLAALEADVTTLNTSVGTLKTSIDALTAATFSATDTEVKDEALTVSGGATPAYTSAEITSSGASILAVIVDNKGASTSLVVKVFGKIGTLGYTDKEIGTFTCTATAGAKCQVFSLGTVPYDKVKVTVTNADAANATTFDLVVRIVKKPATA